MQESPDGTNGDDIATEMQIINVSMAWTATAITAARRFM